MVVLIVGLLAAIGTPRYVQSTRSRAARNAVIQLAGYVDYVRNTAINEGRSARLTVDADEDRFFSPDVDFPDQIGTPISVSLKEQYDASLELDASFDSATTLTFDLEGMPTVAGNVLSNGVIVVWSQGVGFRILIRPGLGTATIQAVAESDDIVAPTE